MDIKEAMIMVNGQLRRYKVERRSAIIGEVLFAGSIAITGFVSVGSGLSFLAGTTVGLAVTGINATIESAFIAYIVKDAIRQSQTSHKINILKGLKYELKNGVNRFNQTDFNEFSNSVQNMYTENPHNKTKQL